MDFQEREKKLFQILSGKIKITIEGKRYQVFSPSLEIISDSNEVYFESLQKFRFNGILSKEKLKEILINKRILRNEDFLFIEKAPENIESLQEELYINRENSHYSLKIRDRLKELRKDYSSIINEVSKYDSYSLEGIASFNKIVFVILNTTYYKNKKIKYDRDLVAKIIEKINLKNVSNEEIREISRTTPWQNMWSGLRKNGIVFKDGVNCSSEQKMLMMWSSFYDSLSEAAEQPEDYVIEDDDLLDGWLITQKKKKNNNNNSSFEKYDEVFLLKKDNETEEQFINRIKSMNSKQALKLKEERLQQVFEKGEVNHQDFADVQKDLGIKFNQLMMSKGKKK